MSNKKKDDAEITLEDFEYSSRRAYLFKKEGKSIEKFYNESKKLKDVIAWDTFKAYLYKKRKLPEDIKKILADELNVNPLLLSTGHIPKVFQDLFKENKSKIFEFDFENMMYDEDEVEAYKAFCAAECFKSYFIDNNMLYNNASKKIIGVVQSCLEMSHFDILINDIIELFIKLNNKGREKFIQYGNNLINDFTNTDDLYITDTERIYEKYELNSEIEWECENDDLSPRKIGIIDLNDFLKKMEDRLAYDYCFADFLYLISELPTSDLDYLDIVLISNLLDCENNPSFPQYILKAYYQIVQLFSQDKEYRNEADII